jgi:hypothetical protein
MQMAAFSRIRLANSLIQSPPYTRTLSHAHTLFFFFSPLIAVVNIISSHKHETQQSIMFTAATYLPKPLCECNVVELGAGVGLVGMFTAAKGSPMTYLTDLQEVSIIKSIVPTLLYIF